MKLKEKKAKRKINKVNVAAIIVSIVALLGLICLCAGIGLIVYLLQDKPEFSITDFNSQESSIVYDRNDNQIYELGTVIRQNVEYEDLPTSLIDALVAVEDSRFYEHNGFDMPRFASALIKNIKTMSFAQGASTLTMQLVKNTYFVNDEEGQGAVKSIKRKVQEIATAMELEQNSSKKEILTNYLNKQNFGGTNQNIRGIQKASQYYFGKDVTDLNLPESAMLAGVLNSPYTFNPFNQIEDYAQERRDEVLYLMKYHGYISDTEYQLAIGTRVEDFLVDSSQITRGTNQGTPYQAYIDYVVEEVYKVTGLDPYNTPMHIHTCMDSDVQKVMDNIQAGNVEEFEYPDDEFEVASICVNNKTGEIIGILGGRNYSDGGALLLNHATDQFKQPGSSIKPLLDYVQAFEVLGWATSHCIVDKPIKYQGTDFTISNATNTYEGEITLKYAVAMSLNTPAIQTIRELIDEKGNSYLVDYLTSMGFDIDLTDFDEQYGIGGKGLNVSCLQLAGAYSALMNEGYYTTPHTITKIEFLNEKTPITPMYEKIQTVSEQSCFLMSELLKNNVEGGYSNLMGLFKNDNYKVYAKTGTTNWGTEGAQYNIPNGSIKDGWVVGCTSDYSVATWMGYEKAQLNKISYMTYDVYNKNIKGKITKLILDKTVDKFGYPKDIQKPSGVSSIRHIKKIGLPYVAPIEGMDEEYITNGYIKSSSKYVNLSSPKAASVEQLPSDPEFSLSGTTLTVKIPEYPNADQLNEKDDDSGKLFDYTWAYGTVKYKLDISVTDERGNEIKTKSIISNDRKIEDNLKDILSPGYKVKACAFYGFEKSNVNSDAKCSGNMEVSDEITIEIPNTDNAESLKGYLEKYATVSIEEKTNKDKKGTLALSVFDPNERAIPLGSTQKFHQLQIRNFRIIKYVGEAASISLSSDKEGNKVSIGEGITITAIVNNNDSDDVAWYIDDEEQENNSKTFNVSFPSAGDYTIKAICSGASANITIHVTEDD